MATQNIAMIDSKLNMDKTPKRWVSVIGAREVNQISTPQSNGASNSTSTFNVNVPNATNVVLDRSSSELSIPGTITMAGSAGSGDLLYDPAYECFRANPVHRAMKLLKIQAGTSQVTYEPYHLIDSAECFMNDSKNKEYQNQMLDMVCDYAQYNGKNVSPFAQRFETEQLTRNASIPITVVSNTYNSAVLQFTLITSLDMFQPFDSDENIHGGLFDPLKIDISYIDNLARIWSRSSVHPQNTLTSLTVSLGTATLNLTFYTLPSFVPKPPETIQYPYYDTQTLTSQTTGNITAGSLFNYDTGSQQLNFTPSRVYVYGIVSETERQTNITNMTQIPNFFAEINTTGAYWNNSPVMYSTATQMDLYNLSKNNGLKNIFTYADFIGENGGNCPQQPLKGSILCFDPPKDFGSGTQSGMTGIANKQTLQIKGQMKNQTAVTHSYDIMMIIINEGLMTITGGKNGSTTLAVDKGNMTMSTADLRDIVPHMEASGDAKSFFKGLYKKMQPALQGINKGLKDSKILSTVAQTIPGVKYATPIIKSLGYGDGEAGYFGGMQAGGMLAYGEGEGEGEGYYGGRRPKAKKYLKKVPRRTTRGGSLVL
jgi:hypothetical protein